MAAQQLQLWANDSSLGQVNNLVSKQVWVDLLLKARFDGVLLDDLPDAARRVQQEAVGLEQVRHPFAF